VDSVVSSNLKEATSCTCQHTTGADQSFPLPTQMETSYVVAERRVHVSAITLPNVEECVWFDACRTDAINYIVRMVDELPE
jgi:hypothetical protein